ncbi:MAG: hypothetical protein GX306_07775 [Clostridiales bacterium]|jgi:leader peptidase (prepilin peptidase)/N-methyltransferase|nr:hypothetical protein [Clostridiales bacterium]
MVETAINGILGALLLLCGIQDLRKKRLYLWLVLVGAILIGICIPFSDSLTWFNRMGGATIGIVVILISLATGGKIGMGDGILLCVTGIGLGFWTNLELFALALLGAAIVSIVLLIFRLADRKKSIPFVPFLLISFILIKIFS